MMDHHLIATRKLRQKLIDAEADLRKASEATWALVIVKDDPVIRAALADAFDGWDAVREHARQACQIIEANPGRKGACVMTQLATAPLRILPVETVESRGVHQWLTKQNCLHSLTGEGLRLVTSAIDYLYSRAKEARTEDEADDFTAALGILGAIRKGWGMPVVVAF